MERQKMNQDEAVHHIEKIDKQRKVWTKFLFGINWLDPYLYDLVINLEKLDMDSAVELAATAAARPEFQTTTESIQAIANFALSCRVRAALANHDTTAELDVEVHVDEGIVFVSRKPRAEYLAEIVVRISKQVSGVKDLKWMDEN
jgi:hypothetical protein